MNVTPTLSLAVGGVQVAVAVALLDGVKTVMLDGVPDHVGAVVSLTVSVALRVAVPPLPPKLIVPFCTPAGRLLALAFIDTETTVDAPAPRLPLVALKFNQLGPETVQFNVPEPEF